MNDGNDSIPVSSDEDNDEAARRAQYRYQSLSECSDPDLWQRLHHHEMSSSESGGEMNPSPIPTTAAPRPVRRPSPLLCYMSLSNAFGKLHDLMVRDYEQKGRGYAVVHHLFMVLRSFDENGITEESIRLLHQMVLSIMQMEAETNARSIGVPTITDVNTFALRFPMEQYYVMVDENELQDDGAPDSTIQFFEGEMPDAFERGSPEYFAAWMSERLRKRICSAVVKGGDFKRYMMLNSLMKDSEDDDKTFLDEFLEGIPNTDYMDYSETYRADVDDYEENLDRDLGPRDPMDGTPENTLMIPAYSIIDGIPHYTIGTDELPEGAVLIGRYSEWHYYEWNNFRYRAMFSVNPHLQLSPVNSACTWSSTNELSFAAYVLTRKGNPFHFLRPHGVLARGVTSEDAAGVPLLDGQEKLQELVHLPRTWPLARLTIPLEGLSKQIDRLLEGYCFQILATNRDPEAHNGRVLQTATHLTWILAEYLADTIAWLMRSILGHASKILFDNDTQLLLTPKFWILPLYREFLNSARRIRPSPSSERARGCAGLVKVICKENKEQKGKRKYHAGTPHPNDRGGFTQWFGSCSLMSTLYVWFPASWAPTVAERLFSWSPPPRGSAYPQHGRPASGPPQTYSGAHPWHQHSQGAAGSSEAMEETDSTEVKYKIRQWSLPGATIVPVLNVTSRVFWLELDDKALLDSYAVLQEGILCDVFSQKCSAAWQGARGERLTVGIMLPGRQDADDWLNFMLSQKNLYGLPLQPGVLSQRGSQNSNAMALCWQSLFEDRLHLFQQSSSFCRSGCLTVFQVPLWRPSLQGEFNRRGLGWFVAGGLALHRLKSATPRRGFSQTSLEKLTVVELKKMCKERKLGRSGRKADLVYRLLQFTDSESPAAPADLMEEDVQEDQVDEEDELYTQAQRELHELNCADLRDLCEERGLSSEGLKVDLAKRLAAHQVCQASLEPTVPTTRSDPSPGERITQALATNSGQDLRQVVQDIFEVGRPAPGEIVEGVVTSVVEWGAFVELDKDGWSALIHVSEISDTFVENIEEYICPGQRVQALVIQNPIDRMDRLSLSIKRLKDLKRYDPEAVASVGALTPMARPNVVREEEFEALQQRVAALEAIVIEMGHAQALREARSDASASTRRSRVAPLTEMLSDLDDSNNTPHITSEPVGVQKEKAAIDQVIESLLAGSSDV
eukprot:symbB.v1.2.033004.t1/scaffold4040.1/size45707/1